MPSSDRVHPDGRGCTSRCRNTTTGSSLCRPPMYVSTLLETFVNRYAVNRDEEGLNRKSSIGMTLGELAGQAEPSRLEYQERP